MATYTGTLKDMGLSVPNVVNFTPRLSVRPEVEAWGPDGLIVSKRKLVDVNVSTGAISMELTPSHQLVGNDGRVGVKYVIDLSLFNESADGTKVPRLKDWWRFNALPGGGDIAGMGDGPPVALYIGPPWPAQPVAGAFFDPSDGDLSYYEIEVHA